MQTMEEAKKYLERALTVTECNEDSRWSYGEMGGEIYTFDAESFQSYLNSVPVHMDRTLVLGGSCDKIFTAIALGSEEVVGFDINPLVKPLYELKKAAILTEENPENLLNYFVYDEEKKTALGKEYFERYVKNLDVHAAYIWKNLYEKKSSKTLSLYLTRDCLFGSSFLEEKESSKIKERLRTEIPYLLPQLYSRLRDRLHNKEEHVTLHITDVKKLSSILENQTFSFIHFSSTPYHILSKKNSYSEFLSNQIIPHLEEGGVMALANLYSYTEKEYQARHLSNPSTSSIMHGYPEANYQILNDLTPLHPQMVSIPSSGQGDHFSPFDLVPTYKKTK